MLLLIFVPHILFVFVGYDGLGVVRFVLVIYYGRSQRWVSGLKTFLVKRLGDGLFLVGVLFMLHVGFYNVVRVLRVGAGVRCVLVLR